MKKYMAVWGSLFFCVICISLYLMLETISTSPGRFPDIEEDSLNSFELKINDIQSDIERNRNTIDQIRDAVRKLSSGDKNSVDKLKDLLNSQNKQLKVDAKNIDKIRGDFKSDLGKKHPDTGVFNMEQQIKPVQFNRDAKYDAKTWADSYAPLRKEVSVAKDMCSWSDGPKGSADIQMQKLFEKLPFDNPDGGAWKQGWNVTYPLNQWNANNKLKVFVVPHSHNDPGWVKTYEDYYHQQTKHILDNMLIKLEQHPRGKFMYAEISFFHMWWNELDEGKRQRVKKLFDERRLEIVTGGWVMNDEANSHYFAMLDQLIEGHQWLDGTVGQKPSAGWAIDPFGHTPTMAYLLRRSGFNNMLIQRVHYAVKKHLAKNKQLEFMWRQNWDYEGSTDMLCHMMPFYSYDIPHTCGPEPAVCCQFDFRRLPGTSYNCPWKIAPQPITDANVGERTRAITEQWKKKASLYRSRSLFIPLGDDFRYDKSDEWDLQFNNYIKLFDYMKAHPEIGVEAEFGTLSDYFNSLYEDFKVKPGEKPGDYPTLNGDFYTYADKDDHYWSGYFTSRPFQKNLDRVMESHLRAAEILFTLTTASVRRLDHTNFPVESFMDKLIKARRNLGLFQHHDGITGTAKDFVVVDYGNRLLGSLRDMKQLIKECSTYLTLDTKTEYAYSESAPIYNVDEARPSHDSLPEKSLLELGEYTDEPRPVLFYNPLAQARDEVVKIYVDAPSVEVKDGGGQVVLSQVDPFWENNHQISKTKYKVSFRLTIPALNIVRYTVKRVMSSPHNVPVSVLTFNQEDKIMSDIFGVNNVPGSEIVLENPYLKASFSGANGLLTSVTMKEDGIKHNTKMEFVTYGTSPHSRERSGAYLFLPDGPAKTLSNGPPVVHIMKGPIVSEIHVYFDVVEHVVRLYNSSGIDGVSLDMYNVVDLRLRKNTEIAVRITTDIDNKDRTFYTDLNGYQMQKHKTHDKLTLQGNFYPMPTMAFIEDSKFRFSVLSANSLGFSNLKPGILEVMLDRRLNQDDSRGLGQGVLDSKKTPSRFRLLLEKRYKDTFDKDKTTGFPSLLGHQSSLQLIHPVFVMPGHSKAKPLPKQSTFSPMYSQLPCDVHLLNLRSMQNRDDGPNRLVPKNTAGLFLHRLGIDCGFPNSGLGCGRADGQVSLGNMFNEVQMATAHQVSLTMMYVEEETDTSATLDLEPMEISSYVVTVQ